MACYQFVVTNSRIGNRLFVLGYTLVLVIAAFSIFFDQFLLISSAALFLITHSLEPRNREWRFSCDEEGQVERNAEPFVIQGAVLLTPFWLCFQLIPQEPDRQEHCNAAWCSIFVDQVSPQHWARLQRICLTIHARAGNSAT